MWLKGNLHTHTHERDGDSAPETVVAWYAAHGYDFMAITDHNLVTLHASDSLLMIRASEISLFAELKPVHVNAFNIGEMRLNVDPDASVVAMLQHAVDMTNAAGGLAMINHPNFRWAFGADEMQQVSDWSLLEIYNASTETNNFGFGGRQGVEAMWDRLLTAGQRVHGVATDDAHDVGKERWGHVSPPGLAWVQVWAEDKSVEAVMRALAAGDFYSSTEIKFAELLLGEADIFLRIRPQYDFAYTTMFIGREGHVLSVLHGAEARYAIRGDEGYVRAKVFSSNGGWAWTQPVHL